MLEWLTTWFLVFIVYSFAGWLMEVILSILIRHRLINRGFLIGPICPIYGIGGLLLSWTLRDVDNIFALFCACMVGGAVIEYIISYLMEKIFRVRWWDYADHTFNLNGRICLDSIVAFGILGSIVVKITTPLLLNLADLMGPFFRNITALLLAIALIVDLITSLWLIRGFRVTVGTIGRDATEEISERVREILMQKGYFTRRFYKAFPNLAPKHTTKTRKTRSSRPSKKPTK